MPMKNFLIKLSLFAAPVLFFFLPPAFLLKISGENFTGISHFITQNPKYLIGYAYNDNAKYLKYQTLASKNKYEVLALGSSRILQMRAEMFRGSFYNCGYTVSGILDFMPFLHKIPKEKYPKLLVISLDQFMFNAHWDELDTNKNANIEKIFSLTQTPSVHTIYKVWTDIFNKKYDYKRLINSDALPKIGLGAKINNAGFRADGSRAYGNDVAKLIGKDSTAYDFNFSGTLLRVAQGNQRFEYGSEVNPKAVEELEKVLLFCKKNGVAVVAFLPPFADKVLKKMKQSGNYAYLDGIYPQIKPIFTKYGFELWDFTNPNTALVADDEFLDGFHGGELCYLKMLQHMAQNQSVVAQYTDANKLKLDIKNTPNNYVVYAD